MKPINLSINPTYLCNFRCDFCYLTKEQLSDKKKIEIERIKEMVVEISENGYVVENVDLYGGEIGLLKSEYLYDIHYIFDESVGINVITNFYIINDYFNSDEITLSVSFDFDARQGSDKVLNNIIQTKKDVHILVLASEKVINMEADVMIRFFNSLQNVKSVEIKPYSKNQSNSHTVTNTDFENFVYKWVESKVPKRFDFVNLRNIQNSIDRKYNAFSDNHVYITPNGKFGVLEFDENDKEYFLEFEKFDSYIEWSEIEKNKVSKNKFCSKCEYFGNCLTEHYRDIKPSEDSCSGFKGLLNKAKVFLSK